MKTYSLLYTTGITAAIISAGIIYMSADILGVSIKTLTRDPYSAAQVPPYYAYISLVGSSIWLITGTATLTTALIAMKALGCRISDNSPYRLILLAGSICLFMALDDALLIHDVIAGLFGVHEHFFHMFYAGFLLFTIVYSKNVLKMTPWLLLFLSLICFAMSSFIDIFITSQYSSVLSDSEDIFKFSALVLWAFYFLYVSWDFIRKCASPN